MLTKIHENIYCIQVPIPNSPLRYLNSYLVKGSERDLLIDTGFRREVCRTALVESLNSLNVDMGRTDIFLTHLHADHSGLCSELAAPTTRKYITKKDGETLNEYTKGVAWEMCDALYERFGYPELESHGDSVDSRSRKWCSDHIDDWTFVSEGMVIPCALKNLTVVETPGHSMGHCCLYAPEEEIMFLGDHVLFDITPNITSGTKYDDPIKWYLSSLKKMHDYSSVRLALPGHREAGPSLVQRADELIAHHNRRAEEVYGILREYGQVTPYFCASKMKWKIKCDSWEDFPSEQKWYASGEASAHLEYIAGEGLAVLRKDGPCDVYYLA